MTTTPLNWAGALALLAAIPVAYHVGESQGEAKQTASLRSEEATQRAAHAPLQAPEPLSLERGGNASPPAWLREAGASPSSVRDWAARRTEALLRDLVSDEWKIRRGAAALLRDGRVASDVAVPALMQALDDEEWQVRELVASALSSYGEEAAPAVDALGQALEDEQWHVAECWCLQSEE